MNALPSMQSAAPVCSHVLPLQLAVLACDVARQPPLCPVHHHSHKLKSEEKTLSSSTRDGVDDVCGVDRSVFTPQWLAHPRIFSDALMQVTLRRPHVHRDSFIVLTSGSQHQPGRMSVASCSPAQTRVRAGYTS